MVSQAELVREVAEEQIRLMEQSGVRTEGRAQSALIRAENQRLQNRVDLYLALGGDFDTQYGDPAPPRRASVQIAPASAP